MPASHIRFSSDILRRLGEELNPSFDQGVLELVKNAYDADALECVVTILDDRVVVEDDGDGMGRDDIESGWLVIGSSRKKQASRTKLGRVPAGNKGLGRLAALRLGQDVLLQTTTRNHPESSALAIDWDEFDGAGLVDAVDLEIEDGPGRKPHGTRITISNLRRSVGRADVKRLARAMILLGDPFGTATNSFNPRLEATAFDDLSRLVSSRYFADAEYHLRAFLEGGKATAEVLDWQDNVLLSTDDLGGQTKSSTSVYEAPNAQFELWTFNLLGANWVARAATLTEVREWLAEFGGIHVYVDALRVAPYGNPGNDWLDLNLARAKSPEVRPSTNNSIGRLVFAGDHVDLVQKTDRSGFIETSTFEELKRFSVDALDWMAKRRLSVAETRRQSARADSGPASESSRDAVVKSIASISDSGAKREVERNFAAYNRARDRETSRLRKEVQLYRTLGTAGITAAVFAHESTGNPLKVIDKTIDTIEFRAKRGMPDDYSSKLAEPIERVRAASASLGVLSSATLRIIDADKRRSARINLDEVVSSVLATFAPFFENRGVRIDNRLAGGSPIAFVAPAAIESMVTNLLNNSVSALDSVAGTSRKIRLTSTMEEGTWRLLIEDNGPGIEGISVADIWLPGETRRPGGTGLGLTIVKDAVTDLGGSVEATPHGDLGGAAFELRVPTLGTGT